MSNCRVAGAVKNGQSSKYEALEFLISALEAIEFVHSENGDEMCPWCGALSPAEWERSSEEWKKSNAPGHRKDCLRQVALRKSKYGVNGA